MNDMKINSSLVTNAYQSTLNLKDKIKNNAHSSDIKSENTDKVMMSNGGMNAAVVAQASKKVVDDVNGSYSEERLNALKAAIDKGTYSVSAENLADAMLQHTWEA